MNRSLVLAAACLLAMATVEDSLVCAGTWSTLGIGVNGAVCAATVYNGNLVIGGSFATAGGVTANCIASWNGSSWSSLGSGMTGGFSPPGVYAITVHNNMLIAGGDFAEAGGVGANRIAAWDGTAWSPLGSGVNNTVQALTVYNGMLIAGGISLRQEVTRQITLLPGMVHLGLHSVPEWEVGAILLCAH